MKIKNLFHRILSNTKWVLASSVLVLSMTFVLSGANQTAYAAGKCGTGKSAVPTKFDFGCDGSNANPILDITFSIIRFMSVGVGVFAIISVVFAGIRYTTSEGNPEQTAEAKRRLQNTIMALMAYIFIFAMIQYLVPGGVFN